MIIILIRTVILYAIVLLMLRLMGKAELAEMEPFQLVVILMIAELAALPMEDTDVSLMNGITALATLLLIQVFISYLSLKSEKARLFFCGRPSILVNKGKIVETELKKMRININDLLEQLRSKNISSLDDVEYVILETNGDMNIVQKPETRPITPKDLDMFPTIQHMSLPVIVDGILYKESLTSLNLSEEWLWKQLKKSCIDSYDQILFCYIDESNQIHIHRKNMDKGDVSS